MSMIGKMQQIQKGIFSNLHKLEKFAFSLSGFRRLLRLSAMKDEGGGSLENTHFPC